MSLKFLALSFLVVPACFAQQSGSPPAGEAQAAAVATQAGDGAAQTKAASMRTTFHVRYVDGADVYIDGGRNAGLVEGMKLVLKQDPVKPADKTNTALEPGIVARLTVISVASTSAVCEVNGTTRDLAADDEVALPDAEIEKLVVKDTLGNTRKYPLVISFSQADPLDEEVRNEVPRPPLPEVNEMRGRIGFDVSTIRQLGQGGSTSTEYGMLFRADFTRIFGTHWNLNGYWRGELQSGSSSAPTLQDLINRTYLISLSYVNPESNWAIGVGRLYLPWASSLEVIDGGYVARKFNQHALTGVFGGSTPDPTAWNYDPQRTIGGGFINVHGGSFEAFQYSSTIGAGISLLSWQVDRPFVFTENTFSYKRYLSVFESMQIDRPKANPGTPPIGVGIGQSLVSVRAQVHPRVTLELTDTRLRDVPTYSTALVGTGLLDQYLYQGVSGGARVLLPSNLTGYFNVGQSSDSNDPKSSLNQLYGVSKSNILKTGILADVRYSEFHSSFASGSYRTLTVSRNIGERFRLNLQGGKYAYNSTLAANNNSIFVNLLVDTNLGSRLFLEGAYTTQRGGSIDYDQFTTTLGLRFDNRSKIRKAIDVKQP